MDELHRLLAELAFKTPEEMSSEDLMKLRSLTAADPEMQKGLAPFEHQAFAREYAMESPLHIMSLLAAIPGYQAIKMLGLGGPEATPPSFAQFERGLAGMAQGVFR